MAYLPAALAFATALGLAAPVSDSRTDAVRMAEAWGQNRLDRVAALDDRPSGSLRFRLSDSNDLSSDASDGEVAFPKVRFLTAQSTAEIDALLAVVVSALTEGDRAPRRPSLASTIAYGALIAATGGASDPTEGKDSKVIPTGSPTPSGGAIDRGEAVALRSARWNERLGHCMATFTAVLRTASRSGKASSDGVSRTWSGDPLARRTLRNLGMLASPIVEACPAPQVTELRAIQAALTAGGKLETGTVDGANVSGRTVADGS